MVPPTKIQNTRKVIICVINKATPNEIIVSRPHFLLFSRGREAYYQYSLSLNIIISLHEFIIIMKIEIISFNWRNNGLIVKLGGVVQGMRAEDGKIWSGLNVAA